MGSPGSAGSAIRNMNEEQRFRDSKRFRNAMKKLSNVSDGKDGYASRIPSRVINKYILKGVSLNQAINDIEKKIKYYKNMNTILTHSDNFNANRFQKFIQTGINRGVINYTIAEKLGRERMKRAKAKEPKSPNRIEKRNMYKKELNNLPRNEAKNKLEKLFCNHKINFKNYAYLEGKIQNPRKLLSVAKKELKKKKGNNR